MADNDVIFSQLESMQTSIDMLGRGLILMTETLGTHSEMLAQILKPARQIPAKVR